MDIKKHFEKTKDTFDEEAIILANAINCPLADAKIQLEIADGDFGTAMYLIRQVFNGLTCEEKNRRRR